jgi:hypothetical protein
MPSFLPGLADTLNGHNDAKLNAPNPTDAVRTKLRRETRSKFSIVLLLDAILSKQRLI